jgi:hypothetical protein
LRRQLSGNLAKIQSDRISHVTPIPDSDRTDSDYCSLVRRGGMIRVILCPVQTSVAFTFISASTSDIVCTHMVHSMQHTMGNAPKCCDLLAMAPTGVQATAAAVAVAAARAERNNIRGFWTGTSVNQWPAVCGFLPVAPATTGILYQTQTIIDHPSRNRNIISIASHISSHLSI